MHWWLLHIKNRHDSHNWFRCSADKIDVKDANVSARKLRRDLAGAAIRPSHRPAMGAAVGLTRGWWQGRPCIRQARYIYRYIFSRFHALYFVTLLLSAFWILYLTDWLTDWLIDYTICIWIPIPTRTRALIKKKDIRLNKNKTEKSKAELINGNARILNCA